MMEISKETKTQVLNAVLAAIVFFVAMTPMATSEDNNAVRYELAPEENLPEMVTVPVVYANGEESSIYISTASLKDYNITQTAGGAVIYMDSPVKSGVEPSTPKEKPGFFEFVWHDITTIIFGGA